MSGSSKTWGETWDIKLWGKIWGWGKSWGGVHDVNMGYLLGCQIWGKRWGD